MPRTRAPTGGGRPRRCRREVDRENQSSRGSRQRILVTARIGTKVQDVVARSSGDRARLRNVRAALRIADELAADHFRRASRWTARGTARRLRRPRRKQKTQHHPDDEQEEQRANEPDEEAHYLS